MKNHVIEKLTDAIKYYSDLLEKNGVVFYHEIVNGPYNLTTEEIDFISQKLIEKIEKGC